MLINVAREATEQTDIFNAVDRSDEPDILDSIPTKSRVHAAAWMAGQDLRQLLSNGTFYRHARVLRDYGIDITEPRNARGLLILITPYC